MNLIKWSEVLLRPSSHSGLTGGEIALGGRGSPLPWDDPEALAQI